MFTKKTGLNFDKFYLSTKDQLINYLKQISIYNIDLEGLVDTSYMKLYKHISNYNSSLSSVKTYLYKIAINELKATNRKKSIKFYYTDDIFLIDCNKIDEVEYDLSVDKNIIKMKKIIKKYNYKELELKLEGLNYQEISNYLNITLSAVKSRIFLQKKYIKRNWKKTTFLD